MTTRAKRAAAEQGLSQLVQTVSLEDLSACTTTELVAKVAGDALHRAATPGSPGPKQPGQSAAAVVALLERFERCDKELARLQQQVDMRAERLRREVGAEEAGHEVQLAGLEEQWGGVRGGFAELEGRLTGVTQAATKIGNRLQNADLYRRRALAAADKIGCLQEFAHAREPSSLPPPFHDDARLAEAASLTGQLLSVTRELLSSRESGGPGEGGPRAANTAPEVGTLEHAGEQLELYRGLVDNRVVTRFDAALARHDLPAMADCARIMAQFSRGEDLLVQRYISTRPMFTNLREAQFVAQQQAAQAAQAAGGAAVDEAAAADAAAAADLASLRGLSGLYKGILLAMRDEAVVIEQVFPSPARALATYTRRVFEQKVQAAVDAVLRPPPPGAGHALLRARLRLMAEVYRKTAGLANDLQELCGGEGAALRVRDLADMCCAGPLESYLPMELRWLAGLYDAKVAAAGPRAGLSMEAVLDLLAMNEEAATRVALLSPPALLAAHTRALLHASTHSQAHTGCLLEQVAAHFLRGLAVVLDDCTRALQGPFRPQQLLEGEAAAAGGGAAAAIAGQQQGAAAPAAVQSAGQCRPASRASLQRAAQLASAGGVGQVLQAVSAIGAMVSTVQRHYQTVLAPHLAGSGAEARACGAGLAALVRAVDERVAGALKRCLALLSSQADATLVAQQARGDFRPSEADPPPLDEPTPACLAVCALLGAAVDAAEAHLHGPNLASFLAELGRRLGLVLEAHQQRFTFSPLGALRWRRDLADYAALAARLRSLPARRHLEDMQANANMLVVAPGSLVALVDGSLRIPHRAAVAVIRLREDFATARVGEGGASLAAAFASE